MGRPELPLGTTPPGDSSTWVEGRIVRVLWSSERSGYGVVRFAGPDEEFIAVGPLADLTEQAHGAFVALEGQWQDHPTHGRQFRCTGALHGSPRSLEGMQLYLASSGVKGVGPALARRLVEHFGMSTPAVLTQSPQRVAEVPGIGPAKAKAIREAWTRDEEGRALAMTLRGLGVSRRLVQRIRDRYGDQAANVVQQHPYQLAEQIHGVGFRTADALARQQGLPADAPERVRAAVVYALEQEANDGHCWTGRDQLARRLERLNVPTSGMDEAVDAAEGAGRVVVERNGVWWARLYDAESLVARELGAALRDGVPTGVRDAAIEAAEGFVGVQLDPSQREAVRLALRGGPVVITGGPGTGKTTLLRVLLRVWTEEGLHMRLASPTGRAARRLAEATGLEAVTLHRLLEFEPGTGRFARGPGQWLEGDGVVVDEASMIDIELMAALVSSLPPDRPSMPMVFVGDADQLPSVGPGQVLQDLVAASNMPVARLRQVHRQAEGSGILTAAADIQAGRVPRSGGGTRDVFLLHRADAEQAADTLLAVVQRRLPANGFDPVRDIQVLAPTRRGPLGTEVLNRRLQEALNPAGDQRLELVRGERAYRVGDRVICVRNRYDVEVFNGDVGQIVSVDKRGLVIDFEGRSVPWERDDLPMLDLAYAVTVHKSQGSEYPAVVLALHGSHSLMLRRNLFYTALTRAKRFVCVVGNERAWAQAVARSDGDARRTGLTERLLQHAAAPDALERRSGNADRAF